MPYFISHYFDFKGRCPNKPYWTFFIYSQLILFLLSCPYWVYFGISLLQDEAMRALCEHIERTMLQIGDPPYLEIMLIVLRVMGESLMSIQQAGLITLISTIACIVLLALLFIPSVAMTVCRLRDAGSSQLWWLSIVPSYIIIALLLFYPDCSLLQGQNFSLISALSNIPILLFFAMLCKPSKPASDSDT